MKKLLSYINNSNIGQEVEVIAFDIFDTIVTRQVYPEYTKKIWSKDIVNLFQLNMTWEKLYSLRNQLESQLCSINQSNGYDLEFNYNTLIEEIYKHIENKDHISFDQFKSKCISTEVAIELRVQIVDQDWIKIVQGLHEMGKKVICISDFYLSKDMLSNIFEGHGILNQIDEIYVSSEYLLTKRSGRLYDKVLEEINVLAEKVLMIGDNRHSDYDMPIQKGLKTYHIDRVAQHEFYKEHERKIHNKEGIVQALNKLNKRTTESFFENIVFSLYAFIDKLYSKLLQNEVKDVFFLSREGEFLKKLFDYYREKHGYKGVQFINSHYIIVSRKSTFLPSLKNLEIEDFNSLFRQYRAISLYDFLSSINFDEVLSMEIANQLGVELKERQEDFPTSIVFEKLKVLPLFTEAYNKKRIEQNANFKQYIRSYNVNIESEGLHIVDVGWKGTIQDNIYRIYEEDIAIHGYYMGMVAHGDMRDHNYKYGLLFNCLENKTPYYSVYNENRALFEMLLAASHGSANGYAYNEQSKQVEALTYHEEKELSLFKDVIEPIQKHIMSSFEQITEILRMSTYSYEELSEIFARFHANMVFFPNKKEIEFFRRMYHFENFGVFTYTTFDKKNLTIKERIKNFEVLVVNPKGILERGFWGPITLEDQGLGCFKGLYGYYRMRKNFK